MSARRTMQVRKVLLATAPRATLVLPRRPETDCAETHDKNPDTLARGQSIQTSGTPSKRFRDRNQTPVARIPFAACRAIAAGARPRVHRPKTSADARAA